MPTYLTQDKTSPKQLILGTYGPVKCDAYYWDRIEAKSTDKVQWPLRLNVRPYTVAYVQVVNDRGTVTGGGNAPVVTVTKSLDGENYVTLGAGITVSSGAMSSKLDLEAVNSIQIDLTTPSTYTSSYVKVYVSLAIAETDPLTMKR